MAFLINPYIYGAATTGCTFPAIDDSGLVAYYKLDGNSDDFLGTYDASSETGMSYPEGYISSGASFNGSSSVVQFGTRWIDSLSSMTISCMIKPNASTYSNFGSSIVQYETGVPGKWFSFNSTTTSENMQFAVDFGGDPSNRKFSQVGGFSTGDWHHAVGIRDAASGEIRLYRNFSGTTGVTTGTATSTLTLGGQASFGTLYSISAYFNGEIDEVTIWDRVLTEAEIETLYNQYTGDGCPFSATT